MSQQVIGLLAKMLNAFRRISSPRRKVRQAVEELDSYKVVILGGSAVGKSSLIQRHFYDRHNYSHSKTLEDLYKEKLTVENVPFELDIIDTSGSERLPAMRRQAILNADVVVIVYALDDSESFVELPIQFNEVMELRKSLPPTIIVGNKADECTLDQKERQKRRDYIVNELLLRYVECSAREGTNVNEVFEKHVSAELSNKRRLLQQPMSFFRKRKGGFPAGSSRS